jgi:hypothetical protein
VVIPSPIGWCSRSGSNCAGTKTYTFTYTNCDGTTVDWIYTYTIAAPTFTLPAPGASSVACIADAVMPTPPAVTDNCGNTITPSAGVAGVDPTCAGTKTYTFTYTNCDGTTVDWIYTYTIARRPLHCLHQVLRVWLYQRCGDANTTCVRITVVIPSPLLPV